MQSCISQESHLWRNSNFQSSIEGNSGLLYFCCTLLCDWSRKLAPFSRLHFALWLVQKTRATLHQSDAKVNQITRVFPHFTQFSRFSFEFSLAVKGIFLSSDWPIWSPGFWFAKLQRKALRLCVVLCGRSRVVIDTMILWRRHINLARWVSFRVKQNKISFVRACEIIAQNVSCCLDQRLQTVVEQFTSGLSTVVRQRIDLLPIIYRRFIKDYWLSSDLLNLFYALFYFLSFFRLL